MNELVSLARRNPWLLIAGAGVAGWVLGAGALPFSLPSFGSAGAGTSSPAPAATHPAATPPASGAPAASSSIATSSPSMAGGDAASDPFAGYGL